MLFGLVFLRLSTCCTLLRTSHFYQRTVGECRALSELGGQPSGNLLDSDLFHASEPTERRSRGQLFQRARAANCCGRLLCASSTLADAIFRRLYPRSTNLRQTVSSILSRHWSKSADVHATRWTISGAPDDSVPSPVDVLRTADRAARLGVKRRSSEHCSIEAISAPGY